MYKLYKMQSQPARIKITREIKIITKIKIALS